MATSTRRTTTTVQTASLFVVSKNQKSDYALLADLFAAYYSARMNKRATSAQMKFEQNLEKNLVKLWDDIRFRKYKVGRSMCFVIHDPVHREVFAASFRDRIVHHLLFDYLNPVLEPLFIEDSYSCRKEKGTHYGVQRMMTHMSECLRKSASSDVYVLKLDIQGYFMNIDRSRLLLMATEIVAESDQDIELVQYLLQKVILNDPTKGCRRKGHLSDWNRVPPSKSLFHSPSGVGLPIGNLTSQLFSNLYLSKLDNYVTRELGFRHYGRYVDDFYIVSPDKAKLLSAIPQIRSYLKTELGLTLHPQKVYLQSVWKGVRFLGYWVSPDKAVPAHASHHRVNSRLNRMWVQESDPYYRETILNGANLDFPPKGKQTSRMRG